MAAGDQLEIGAFQFQRYGAASQSLGFGAVGDLFGQAPDVAVEDALVGGVIVEGGFLGDGLQFLVPVDAAVVLAPGQVEQAVAHLAEAGGQVSAVPSQEVGDGSDAGLVERALRGGADAPEDPDGFGGEEGLGFGLADHGKSPGFVEVGGDLGEELVVGQADGAGQAKLILHPLGQAGQHHGGGVAVQTFGAGQVQKCLVQREGFDGGGQVFHHRADGPACLDIGGETGLHHDRLGAEFQGLEHRHGRADALDPGEVAAGRDHPPCAAADDDGLVADAWIVALFDGGIEGVAVHVGDGKPGQFRVRNDAGRPADGAAGTGFKLGEAVAAEGGHLGRVAWGDTGGEGCA